MKRSVLPPIRSLHRLARFLPFAVAIALALGPANRFGNDRGDERGPSVVVANRGSGDLSVFDVDDLSVDTFKLPGEAEPMYVSHDRRSGRVLVGDRASNKIVALDDETYEFVDSVEVDEGVFHQSLNPQKRQLWVVSDTSGTVTVIDSRRLKVRKTIEIPSELIERGGAPHDVYVTNRHAFVSIVGLDSGDGVVLRYSTRTFAETGWIDTGGAPHLIGAGGRLYVASQADSSVTWYDTSRLIRRGSIGVPAAHGVAVGGRDELLVANVAGEGVDAVWELDRDLNEVSQVTDTSLPTPHNLAVDDRLQVWVTHSGSTANSVSVFDIDYGSEPVLLTAGTNPFGLAYVR